MQLAGGPEEEQAEEQHQADGRERRPRAHADQLHAWTVVLDGEQHPDAPEEPAPHLEVPAVEVASPPNHRARSAANVRGQGSAGPTSPRRRHGVSPCSTRPSRRASGCRQCSTAVSARRRRRARRVRGLLANDAPAAPTHAWSSEAPTAAASTGSVSRSGTHAAPSAESPASVAMTRYHSGISGNDPSTPAAGS